MASETSGTVGGEPGQVLWVPGPEQLRKSHLARYMRWLESDEGLGLRAKDVADYQSLHDWSVRDLGQFWRSIADYFHVDFATPPHESLGRRNMPEAEWFPGASLNYAECALRRRGPDTAVIALDEVGSRIELTRDELVAEVTAVQAGLRALGVGLGDRVAAFLPNGIEALVAFLATASLGAIWSSCAPEFGAASVLDRFRQIEPKVLIAVDGYRYGGKAFDRTSVVESIVQGLPTLETLVTAPVLAQSEIATGENVRRLSFDELKANVGSELTLEAVPFAHPLWVLYSSGTTGLPKPIVQGHGGIVLEHVKALALHCDLGAGDRFFWFSTTGWMMWNFLIGGLLVGTTIVLYDGSPGHPNLDTLWAMAERERLTYFGTSAPFLLACRKAELEPGKKFDLSALRGLGSTGAPLPPEGFQWVYDSVSRDLLLGSISGGTDVCTAFALSCPLLPVKSGALQCAGLGCSVEAFDESGQSVIGEVGELVITEPMPSMPIGFWGDTDGSRYRAAYFEDYPGVWRHGDWVEIAEDGSMVISGRSDSTLNRGGVRMGTSDFYSVVEAFDLVADSLVVDTTAPGESEGKLWLFVVPKEGRAVDDVFRDALRRELRTQLSPRHVPDAIVEVRAVPRTLSGKKCEVPIKRILLGADPERAINRDTLADPTAVDEYLKWAHSSR